MRDALHANLHLRTADRVMLQMGRFAALTFDELFEGVRALPWEDLLPRSAALPVTGKCARSQLMSVRDVQAITKKAIVERLKKAYGLQWLPEDGPSYAVDAHMHGDVATLCVDASGAGLSRRGYRTWNGEAPLRETLAAAMCLVSPWRPGTPLLDPMCGTGTIAIEAALLAINRAPGIARTFAMEAWAQVDKTLADKLREEARQAERPTQAIIVGSDKDPEALELARRHIAAARVENIVQLRQCDAADARGEGERGAIIVNPPYGERLGAPDEADAAYRALRAAWRAHPDWSLTALTSNTGFERAFGKRADKRRRLFNGRIECELLQYFAPRR
jgi:putative N6-adenine-specific DNA methylase